MSTPTKHPEENQLKDVDELIQGFEQLGYVTDRALATSGRIIRRDEGASPNELDEQF